MLHSKQSALCLFSWALFFGAVLWEEAGTQGHGRPQTHFSQPWGQQCPLHRLSLCGAYTGLVRDHTEKLCHEFSPEWIFTLLTSLLTQSLLLKLFS